MLDPDDRWLLRHLPGLFDRAVLADVVAHFEAREAQLPTTARSERDAAKQRIGAAVDALRLDPTWYDVWRAPRLAGLFAPFTWVTFPVQLRHVHAPEHLVPWHQDEGYMRLLSRRHTRVITCFVPLEPDPTRASTLEFATGRHAAHEHRALGGHGAAMTEPDGPKVRFALAFGDAMVFGDHVPHQTVPAADGAIDRRSFEFRLVVPADAMADKDYFDLTTGMFTRTDGSTRTAP
jgi:hypothetical protein